MYSAFIIHFATDVLAQGQQQKPKKCIQSQSVFGVSALGFRNYTLVIRDLCLGFRESMEVDRAEALGLRWF